MRKIILLTLLLLFTFTLASCTGTEEPYDVDCDTYPNHVDCYVEPEPIICETGFELVDEECILIETPSGDYLEIYYLNDFHGALAADGNEIGAEYIANFINTKRAENPDKVLFIVGGDMLQGSALSNYYEGLSTINILNEMGLEAFTIGNHEFDWGIETVMKYADGNTENGEADFPFLGANIFYKGTTDLIDGIDPYTIIQRGGHKIGVIGTIGYGLERSIATSKIEDYEFGDPMVSIEYYSHYLRTVENCDVIIVMAHDSGSINYDVSQLTGDYKVDAVFNGHSHSKYANMGNGIPEIQSADKGEFVGYVKISFNETGISGYDVDNLSKYHDALFNTADDDVKLLMDQYILETDVLFNTPIITSGDYFSSSDLTKWIAQLIRVSTNADIAFHNYGGTRAPIEDGEVISLGVLYEIWPFDNVIKTVTLTGAQIIALISSGSLGYNTDITTFETEQLYLVATNDYVFDKTTNPFIGGINPTNTGLLLRDIAEDEITLQKEVYTLFFITNDLLTTHLIYEDEITTTP